MPDFKSVQDLYNYIKPALETRVDEINALGYHYIREEDIWNYLKEIKWKNSVNLSIADMVKDILNTSEILIDNYLKSKIQKQKRELYLEEKQDEEETTN